MRRVAKIRAVRSTPSPARPERRQPGEWRPSFTLAPAERDDRTAILDEIFPRYLANVFRRDLVVALVDAVDCLGRTPQRHKLGYAPGNRLAVVHAQKKAVPQ